MLLNEKNVVINKNTGAIGILSDGCAFNEDWVTIEEHVRNKQDEVWNLVQRICCGQDIVSNAFNVNEFKDIFGLSFYTEIFGNNTYSSALSKVKEWEAKKNEIKTGDIIYQKLSINEYYYYVTETGTDIKGKTSSLRVLNKYKNTTKIFDINNCTKIDHLPIETTPFNTIIEKLKEIEKQGVKNNETI